MNRIYLFSLLFGLSGGAMAQASEAYWKPGITPTDAQAVLSAITPVSAAGTGNVTTEAVITQNGANNQFSFVGTAGNTGNQITFNQQGNNNQLEFSLTGSNNTYTFGQDGNRNVLNLKDFSTNGAKLEIQQTGNNNRLESTGYPFNESTIPLKITQSGGAQLIITSTPGFGSGIPTGTKQ